MVLSAGAPRDSQASSDQYLVRIKTADIETAGTEDPVSVSITYTNQAGQQQTTTVYSLQTLADNFYGASYYNAPANYQYKLHVRRSAQCEFVVDLPGAVTVDAITLTIEGSDEWQVESISVYQLSGPVSILSCMMPLNSVFKSWRKEPEAAKRCLDATADMLLAFAREIRAAGVKYISYSDPAGSRDILGPKYSRQMAEEFTLPFLKRLAEACGEETDVTVCPLTAQALFSENLLAAAKAGEKGEIAAACVKRSGLPERRSFRLA